MCRLKSFKFSAFLDDQPLTVYSKGTVATSVSEFTDKYVENYVSALPSHGYSQGKVTRLSQG